MIDSEQDLIGNLIELTPKYARRRFRNSIFKSWEWKCAYCDRNLDEDSATIDHVVPKFKGGHNVKSNMVCCCSKCNRLKGSILLDDWYIPSFYGYSEQRLAKIRHWMEHGSCSITLLSADKAVSYISNDYYITWIST